jgi:hypothetical protein
MPGKEHLTLPIREWSGSLILLCKAVNLANR